MTGPVGAREWRNWADTERATARRVVRVSSARHVVEVVRWAAERAMPVKAVGSGHSFTGIAVTTGVRLDLSRLDAVRDIRPDTGQVVVGAGITLARLNEVLWQHGLAMTNLGDIDRQTLSGAIATGTHGTGLRFGGLATQAIGLELVLADGSLTWCSATDQPELFAAARVGLGALGIVTAVRLQCEPAYALHADERPERLSDVLASLDETVEQTDHFELYWFPHTDRVQSKRNTRLPLSGGLRPLTRLRGWVDDELLSNKAFEAVNRLGTRFPRVIPQINQVSARALTRREFTDRSYRVFVGARDVRFREMEYAIPRSALPDVLREMDTWIRRSGEQVAFPVEVRFAAADDIWLSTAYDRESAYVAVHRYHRRPYERYFDAVEAILAAADGRPHWGKLHGLDAEQLRDRYPRYDEFVALRDRVDPDRRFTNPYLERVLGR